MKHEFSPIMEHDSHEFFLYLLNKLKDELTDKSSKLPLDATQPLHKLWNTFTSSFPSLIDQMFTLIEKTIILC